MRNTYPKYSSVPIRGRLKICLELLKAQGLKGKTLIDIGCSNGLLISQLRGEGLKKIIGLDPNESAILFARENIKYARFLVSSADTIALGNNQADIVSMFDVIEHVPPETESKVLTEARRVLKIGGVILLSTPNNSFLTNVLDPAWYFGHRHYRIADIKNLFKRSGFKVEWIGVKGDIWFSIYLIYLYTMKHIFKINMPKNSFLEKKDDDGFANEGIHTIFVLARKVEPAHGFN